MKVQKPGTLLMENVCNSRRWVFSDITYIFLDLRKSILDNLIKKLLQAEP